MDLFQVPHQLFRSVASLFLCLVFHFNIQNVQKNINAEVMEGLRETL